MTTYTAIVEAPVDDGELLAFMVEKIREIAWPRIHVTIEADTEPEFVQKLDDLNGELRSRNLPGLDLIEFTTTAPEDMLRWVIGMAAAELTMEQYTAAHRALDEVRRP